MAFLITFHWGWLLGALAIGFGMGWVAVVHRAPGVPRLWVWLLSALAVALVLAALTHVIPGRAGYWLELLLLLFVPYLAGCAVGSWLRAWVVFRSMRAKPKPAG
jgi:hypothetical protein